MPTKDDHKGPKDSRIVVYHVSESKGREMSRLLTRVVSRVYRTVSFQAAKKLASEKAPEFLVYNSRMEGAKDLKKLSAFRRRFPNVAIVVASRDSAEEPLALSAGATAFVRTPASLEAICEALGFPGGVGI